MNDSTIVSAERQLEELYNVLHKTFIQDVKDFKIIYKNLDTKSEYSMVQTLEPLHQILMTQRKSKEEIKVFLEAPFSETVELNVLQAVELSFPMDVIRNKLKNNKYMYVFLENQF